MAANSLYTGIAGGNPSGSNAPIPTVGGGTTPAVGSSTVNPLGQEMPSGTAAPSLTSAGNFPANTGGTDLQSLINALSGMNVGGANTGAFDASGSQSITQGFHDEGYNSSIAALLTQFLSSGAGFNPQVIASLIASLQPQISQGSANIMSNFGAAGLGESSSASLGLGNFLSQATLDEGQIISSMYEQSVSNYMNVLMSGGPGEKNTLSGLGSAIGGLLSGSGSALSGISDIMDSSSSGSSSSSGGGLMSSIAL